MDKTKTLLQNKMAVTSVGKLIWKMGLHMIIGNNLSVYTAHYKTAPYINKDGADRGQLVAANIALSRLAKSQTASLLKLRLLFPQNLCKQIFCGSPVYYKQKRRRPKSTPLSYDKGENE